MNRRTLTASFPKTISHAGYQNFACAKALESTLGVRVERRDLDFQQEGMSKNAYLVDSDNPQPIDLCIANAAPPFDKLRVSGYFPLLVSPSDHERARAKGGIIIANINNNRLESDARKARAAQPERWTD